MTSMRLKFDRKAIGELALRGPAIRRLVADTTRAIDDSLAAEIGDENTTTALGGKIRARGYVRRLGPDALQEEARDGALARALRSARGRF